MTCIPKGGPGYEERRKIQNARFNLFPAEICPCTTEADVSAAIKRAQAGKLRVRAGGHHHEGMCSGDGVLMLDVSDMQDIDVDAASGIATVGPAAKNGQIYDRLWYDSGGPRRIFAGGGCGDVRVGGFLQGGGWGPFSRLLGFGCDNVVSFRIVMQDGSAHEIFPNDRDRLFWAVCGSGGGNFGVVTQYRIKTAPVADGLLSSFTVSWNDPRHRYAVMKQWLERFPHDLFRGLTSFCRVSTPDKTEADPPVLIGGNCLEGADATVRRLERMLPDVIGKASTVCVQPVHKLRKAGFTHPEYQPGPPMGALADQPSLSDTCAGNPFPHKVSSCFPGPNFGSDTLRYIDSYLLGSGEESTARRYLSLHCMGGAMGEAQPNSVVWRGKEVMLQYQAWWRDPKDTEVGGRCIAWLKKFRDEMRGKKYTEGSFINFPDHDIAIGEYYGDKFADLRRLKFHFDPNRKFEFEMGIPPA